MKIFVTGGSGVIGLRLVESFLQEKHDVSFSYLTNIVPLLEGVRLDIRDRNQTLHLIKKIHPDVVIHATALTNVDLCETDHAIADSVNVNGTENVIDACKEVNCRIVYISTSFVFDGAKSTYVETDKTSPSTYYGITKQKGEQMTMDSGLPYLILRTDQPYCWTRPWQHTNSVLRVLEALRRQKVHNEVEDWRNTPTLVNDFVIATKKILDKKAEGVFHVVGSEFISRYEWAKKIADVFGLDANLIKPINSSSLNLPARRVSVNLRNDKTYNHTGYKMKNVYDGLVTMSDEMREEGQLGKA